MSSYGHNIYDLSDVANKRVIHFVAFHTQHGTRFLKIFQESAEHIATHLLATFNEIRNLNAAYNVANKRVATV